MTMDTTLIVIILVVTAYLAACAIQWRRLSKLDQERGDRGHPPGLLR